MSLSVPVHQLLAAQSRERFLRYVQVHTTSDRALKPDDGGPSTPRQWDLLRVLAQELTTLGLTVHIDPKGYVYGVLAASPGVNCPAIGLLAHVDTSQDQSGENVKPRIVTYDGTPVTYPDDAALQLSEEDSPELARYRDGQIIVASGLTLLGADDKAGIAEIMAMLDALVANPDITHGEIVVCFTRDEEIGRGVDGIDLARLPQYCYTVDGSDEGSVESECFDATMVTINFQGKGVHPGYAYGKMVHAGLAMTHFLSQLPRAESPETTRDREGFYYLVNCSGAMENATCLIALRDFDAAENERRLRVLQTMVQSVMLDFPGLQVTLEPKRYFANMAQHIAGHPQLLEHARAAIRDAGLEPTELPIRGGTDGSRLSEMGHPTPNLFAGGMLFHSRKEWVAVSALARAAETLVHLAQRWANAA